MRRTLRLLALMLPLAACQLSLPGRDAAPGQENPITGGDITTTTLDAAPVDAATPATPAAATKPPPARPAPPEAEPDAAPIPDPVATPIPKTDAQIACEKQKGTWARTGDGETRACIHTTRDGGKRCDSKSDCDGECLARSGTCSPIKPLFGCNEVLMDNGAQVTLCID